MQLKLLWVEYFQRYIAMFNCQWRHIWSKTGNMFKTWPSRLLVAAGSWNTKTKINT